MTDNNTPAMSREPQASEPRREQTNLSYRYGTIGIEAVAAAARYSDTRKPQAGTPAAPRIDLRFVESAI